MLDLVSVNVLFIRPLFKFRILPGLRRLSLTKFIAVVVDVIQKLNLSLPMRIKRQKETMDRRAAAAGSVPAKP